MVPQIFVVKLRVCICHHACISASYTHLILTDAAKIFVIKGEPVQLVRGEKSNVKITYPYDLTVAESLLKGE